MPLLRVILVFIKWPVPGHVKTRLAASVGEAESAAIYRRLVEHLVGILNSVPADEIRILFDPAERENDIRDWLQPLFSRSEAVTFEAQSTGGLGIRLAAGVESVFAENEKAAVAAIGSDCIEIGKETFSQTWKALESGDADVVFGPAPDGGYYLVGLRTRQPALFDGIPWSSDETLAASLQAATSAGLQTFLLDEKNDIDTLPDWESARKLIEPC